MGNYDFKSFFHCHIQPKNSGHNIAVDYLLKMTVLTEQSVVRYQPSIPPTTRNDFSPVGILQRNSPPTPAMQFHRETNCNLDHFTNTINIDFYVHFLHVIRSRTAEAAVHSFVQKRKHNSQVFIGFQYGLRINPPLTLETIYVVLPWTSLKK